jgi:hypothetical protein
MEVLSTFFALGTAWYFVLTFAWVILLFYWVAKEFIVLSGFNIFVYLLFIQFIVEKDIFKGFLEHPTRTLFFILGYIVIGFIWSFLKWWLFVNKEALAYKVKRSDWLVKQKEIRTSKGFRVEGLENITLETIVPTNLMEEWKCTGSSFRDPIPKAIKHKRTISLWILYWPISALWSLLDDFIGKVIRMLIVKIRFAYDGITKSAYKNTEEFDI